jgi:hypothetical protein
VCSAHRLLALNLLAPFRLLDLFALTEAGGLLRGMERLAPYETDPPL